MTSMGRGKSSMTTTKLASALVVLRAHHDLPPDAAKAIADIDDEFTEATPDYSKAEAAAILKVSTTTLDKWVEMGLLPMVRVPGYKRERIPAKTLNEVAKEVSELREMGKKRGLLAEALLRLEQEDPAWQREFAELYGNKLAGSPSEKRYVSAAPGPDWDPDDEWDPNVLDFDEDDE